MGSTETSGLNSDTLRKYVWARLWTVGSPEFGKDEKIPTKLNTCTEACRYLDEGTPPDACVQYGCLLRFGNEEICEVVPHFPS